MRLPHPLPNYSTSEELANTVISAISAALAIVGSVVLIVSAVEYGGVWHIVSCSIFATTLILLYTASTLYHGMRSPRIKHSMRVLDHSAIFLLIAGTYTPFVLVNLRGPWGWSLFGVTWTIAVLGIGFGKRLQRRRILAVVLYNLMGWAILVAIKPLFAAVAPMGLILLLTGGLAYTVGVGFYAWRRLPHHHAIWHVFVLLGSTAHYFAILHYVIPAKR
jgi:hemolysin III